jgi:hypothetical protein
VDVRLPLSLSLSLSCSCYLFFLLLLPPTKPTDRRPPSFLTLDQGRQFDMTNQCQVIYPCCYSIRKEHWKKCTNSCFCQPWASCVAHATCCCCFPHRQWRRLTLLSIGIICLSLFLSPSLFRAYPLSFSLSLCYCSVLCAVPLSLSLSLCAFPTGLRARVLRFGRRRFFSFSVKLRRSVAQRPNAVAKQKTTLAGSEEVGRMYATV